MCRPSDSILDTQAFDGRKNEHEDAPLIGCHAAEDVHHRV